MLQLLHLDSLMPADQAFMLACVRNQFLQRHFAVLESYLILGFPSPSLNMQVKFVPFFTVLDLKTGGISRNSETAAWIFFFLILSLWFLILVLSAIHKLFNTRFLRLCLTVVWHCPVEQSKYMTSVDVWTLLPNIKYFPDGFEGLGSFHIKGWSECILESLHVQAVLAEVRDEPCILLMELHCASWSWSTWEIQPLLWN